MLTIEEILQRPTFENAQVVNEHANLQQTVRWVHVLEILNFDTLLHGNEMILSTAVALKEQGLEYVNKLIEHGAACLCIELSAHYPSVPEEIIEAANVHHFPIIVFTQVVRFVDITEDLHGEILNEQHRQLAELDQLSNEFHQFTLHVHGNVKILKKLQEVTGKDLIFLPKDTQAYFLPSLLKDEQNRIQKTFEEMPEAPGTWYDEERNASYLIKPIETMEQAWGLLLIKNCTPLRSFDLLALERATNVLAQNLLRFFHSEENRLLNEQSWVHELLNQKLTSEREARTHLLKVCRDQEELQFRLCIVKMIDDNTSLENRQTKQFQTVRSLRYLFQKHRFESVITTSSSHSYIVLAFNLESNDEEKERFQKIIHTSESQLPIRIFASQTYSKLQHAACAYQEADDVVNITATDEQTSIHFYEDTGIYQLLIKLEDDTLEKFVRTYLAPVLKYDEEKNSELLHTLNIYLEQNCSKQQTATKLHIARQTLYHRLHTIEELLGLPITDTPLLRLATEVAISAYKLNGVSRNKVQ
ncbi:PucR family transcriptional regulator [Geomicrobium sp. JCM 19039]|uniref:PucR family transcriptional regulator n=1 Tax=Geomicrobium sp. JCM 19039 TaxID=1460636 RepID=UPI00045F4917|nr:PucR family transcriptional regulator [Geomicrobium sp. JCM 19039]GAK13506.1 putative regulatory protein [Geomicrobium sp. JCM 19039]